MYTVDNQDTVTKLCNLPQSSVGAPIPVVLASEQDVLLAYYIEEDSEDREVFAIIRFERCIAHMFGPPNDEAFQGHPLAKRGLTAYSFFEIQHSSWIRTLEEMNRVHPDHDRESFLKDKVHFIASFHDSTFECVAKGYSYEIVRGSMEDAIRIMAEKVRIG